MHSSSAQDMVRRPQCSLTRPEAAFNDGRRSTTTLGQATMPALVDRSFPGHQLQSTLHPCFSAVVRFKPLAVYHCHTRAELPRSVLSITDGFPCGVRRVKAVHRVVCFYCTVAFGFYNLVRACLALIHWSTIWRLPGESKCICRVLDPFLNKCTRDYSADQVLALNHKTSFL